MSKHRYSGRIKQDSGTGKRARIKLGFCADRADLLLALKQVLTFPVKWAVRLHLVEEVHLGTGFLASWGPCKY